MLEPAVKFSIAMSCGTAIHREYTLLLDYAESDSAAAVPLTLAVPQTEQSGAPEVRRPESKPVSVHSARKLRPAPELSESAAPVVPGKKKETTRHTKKKAAAGKDVLEVANYDGAADLDLKMSPALMDGAAISSDARRVEENRQARDQFAAIMRGEDPVLAARNEIRAEQLKNKALVAELEKIKSQDSIKEQKDKSSSSLLVVLAVAASALILALLGLVAFVVRRSRNKDDKSWWDATQEQKKNVVDIVDYLQTTAEKGNLDPSPMASSRDTQNADGPASKAETQRPSVNQEEPVPTFKRTGLPALEDTNSSTFNFFSNRGQSIHIEEISDITQEAEFWMSVNDPHRAIEILEPQSRDGNQATPITWLYLLDLYRLVGDEDNYRELRQRFKSKFNAKIPNFHEEVVPGSVRNFEDFAHLMANCCALWKTDDIVPYLESLLIDDREGERVGFDLPVYRDILFLLSICAELQRVQYQSLTKKDDVKITNRTPSILQPLEAHLTVDPKDVTPGEYNNSLNFDLLDFKSGDKGPAT